MEDEERLRRGWATAAGEAPYRSSLSALVVMGADAVADDLPAMATSRSELPVPLRLTLVLLAAARLAPPMKPFSCDGALSDMGSLPASEGLAGLLLRRNLVFSQEETLLSDLGWPAVTVVLELGCA